MQDNQEKCKELLQYAFITWTKKVYKCVGSSLGHYILQDKKKQLSVIWQH